jgi:hypothetical protein
MERLLWNGVPVGVAADGVPLLAGLALVTMGVSFQLTMSFALEGGGAEGVVFLGGGGAKL